MAWKTQQGTKHLVDCKMAFGRKDPSCPRCQELMAGSAPRTWAQSNDARRCAEIKDHFSSHKHLSGGCGPVCTFGEW
jgi:hypothetical protein